MCSGIYFTFLFVGTVPPLARLAFLEKNSFDIPNLHAELGFHSKSYSVSRYTKYLARSNGFRYLIYTKCIKTKLMLQGERKGKFVPTLD